MKPFEKSTNIFLLAALLILFLIFSSGCTDKTIDTKIIVKLDQTGNISKYSLTTTMSEAQYISIKNSAASQGFSSVREYFLRDFKGASDNFDYNEPQVNSGKTIELKNVKVIDPSHTIKPISLKKENGQIYFNDSTFSSDYFFPRSYIKKLDYSLSSPIKIQKHNANFQEDDHFSIQWTYKEDQSIPVLYMVSEKESPENVKTPGFGALTSIFILCIICYFYTRKPKNQICQEIL